MNLLLDKLPSEKNGLVINTDFRIGILFELLMQDNNLSDEDKILATFNLYFNNLPNNLEEAFKNQYVALETVLWFYRCGKEETNNNKGEKVTKKRKQIYSFEYDDEYIYDAFLEQYKIDLNEAELHWWKFKAMFIGLNENILFSKIMGYRQVDLAKIKDKDERNRIKKLKDIYKLPDMRTQEEKENDFASSFW